jgi:TRAP transporter TAXI family solute receptor
MSRSHPTLRTETPIPEGFVVTHSTTALLDLARWRSWLMVLMMLAAALAADRASADNAAPRKHVWAAPDSGSEGFEQLRAIAEALNKGPTPRVHLESSASHVGRARLLREGRAHYAATSVAGSVFAQEGLFAFASPDWGPQPVRAVLMNPHGQLLGVVAAGDAGIDTVADLKGKRIARIKDAPEVDQHLRALLAHAGLGWKDVISVTTEGYAAAIKAVAAGRADAAFAASRTPDLQALAGSKRGLVWPLVPHADDAGWRQLRQWAPYMLPVDAVSGTGLSDKAPVESVSWPYPVLITLARRSSDEVFAMTAELVKRHRDYRDTAPGNAGWEAKRQPLAWAIPWHDGAIRVFREQGLWRSEHQAHHDQLLERQRVLRQAWDALQRAPSPDRDPVDEAAWLRARADALRKAGLDVLWDASND